MNSDNDDKKNNICVEKIIQPNINSYHIYIINKNDTIKEKKINNICYRCGRYGHFAFDCYELLYTNGYYIE